MNGLAAASQQQPKDRQPVASRAALASNPGVPLWASMMKPTALASPLDESSAQGCHPRPRARQAAFPRRRLPSEPARSAPKSRQVPPPKPPPPGCWPPRRGDAAIQGAPASRRPPRRRVRVKGRVPSGLLCLPLVLDDRRPPLAPSPKGAASLHRMRSTPPATTGGARGVGPTLARICRQGPQERRITSPAFARKARRQDPAAQRKKPRRSSAGC